MNKDEREEEEKEERVSERVSCSYIGTVTSKVKAGRGLLLLGLLLHSHTHSHTTIDTPATDPITIECGISHPIFSMELVKQLKNDIRIGDKYCCIGTRNNRSLKKFSELSFSIDCSSVVCLEHCVLGNTGEYRQIPTVHSPLDDTTNSDYDLSEKSISMIGLCIDSIDKCKVNDEKDTSFSDCIEISEVSHGDKKARRQRAVVFSQFVVDTFGLDTLSLGVLDVAGGRGEVSMSLAESGISSLVVDPREHAGCLNPRLRKIMKKRNLPKLEAWHIFFPPNAGVLESKEAVDFIPKFNVSQVVLGLHPDEATEGIVDWAIKNGKGFCVVPCCVFARLFPNRRVTDDSEEGGSKPVRTHEDFCTYLCGKNRGIRRTQLNFEGMNTCLWATAADLLP
jgi:hypothetical protein